MNASLESDLVESQTTDYLNQQETELKRAQTIDQNIKKAVDLLSTKGRYQLILLIFFCLIFVELTFVLLSPTLFFMNPVFTCNGSSEYISEDDACTRLEECKLENDYTLTAYVGLYCGDNKSYRNLIQSMVGFGTIVGLLIINYLSDYKGRKFSFNLSMLFLCAGTSCLAIGGYAKSPFLLIVAMILSGFACNNLMLLSYVISGKFLSNRLGTASIMIYNTAWGVTQMSLYFFSTSFKEWQILLVIWMVIPIIGLFAISFVVLIEDPIFYFNKKMYKECRNSLEKVASYNQSEDKLVQAFQLIAFIEKEQIAYQEVQDALKKDKNIETSIWDQFAPFKNKKIIMVIVGLGLFGLGNNINYYALEYSIEKAGNSFSINVIILGASEIIGSLLTILVANRIRRKLGAISTAFLQGAVGMLFLFSFVQDSSLSQTIIIFMARLMGTFAYSFYAFLEVESFPQAIQSLSIGFVEFICQTGKFFAPYLVTMSEDDGIDPVVTLSLQVFALCLFPMLLVKETFKSPLQVTEKESTEKERYSVNIV